MRAMQVTEYGHPLQLQQIDKPSPQAGEILLKIHCVGMNFADTLLIKGTYQEKPPLPFTMGMEICGTIEETGSEVTHLSVGQRVAVFAGLGGLAEYGCFNAQSCVPIPDVMPAPDAAAFLIAYGTSHVALDYKANLKAGERLLVLGASGGIGLTAIELGKLIGAEVIAVARGDEKLKIAKAKGADHLINSETDDIRELVKSLGGADVVYDPVGGDQFKAAMRACNPEARLIPLGFASGEVPQIPANILLVKNLTVIGLYWGGYAKFKPSVLRDSFTQLFKWYGEGRLKPHISHMLPLERANEALELLTSRKSTGKVVVNIG
ncbi:MAG: NADPH:quinone oxidoreductase family protein [Alphaproteobacteria bacterium]|nr:NADPH:quinone oxidoreductase family protein [Alphaproteobacteria bacterium]